MQRREKSSSEGFEDTFQSALKRLLSAGAPYREAKRGAFDQTKPILANLTSRFPAVDVMYCLWLLGDLTRCMAPLNNRNVVTSWRAMVTAYDDFKQKAEAFRLATGGFQEIRASWERYAAERSEGGKRISCEGIVQQIADESADPLNATFNPVFARLDKMLVGLGRFYGLSPERPERGRTSYPWIDAVAWCLAEHFKEKTRTPQWSTISKLLQCVPLPGDLLEMFLAPYRIRQRLVRWKRLEDRGGHDPGLWPLRDMLENAYEQFQG